MLAAEHTGRVTGVDPAPRLLQVARARAASDGKKVDFLPGDAASLPAGDASVDVILSVFAAIFAPDPGAAAREMSRVLAPGGRIVLGSWIPAGAMFEMTSAASRAPSGRRPGRRRQSRLPGMTVTRLASLLEPYGVEHGVGVDVDQRSLAFCASSAQQFLDQETQNHPLAVAGLRSSASSAKPRRCVTGCWQSWRTATRTPPASG